MPADWLNYHHLLYFWMVAREGSMAAAGERLHLAQPTLSTQIKQLERSLGMRLFEKRGRQLVLTDSGRTVYRYADEIFELGREMTDVLRGLPAEGTLRLAVGVPDVLSKLVVYRLLQPALRLEEEVSLETREGKFDQLMVDLASHRLDVVLSETPLHPHSHIRAFNHELGECGMTCFATRPLANRYRAAFPQSLDGAPMLLPTQNTAARVHSGTLVRSSRYPAKRATRIRRYARCSRSLDRVETGSSRHPPPLNRKSAGNIASTSWDDCPTSRIASSRSRWNGA